jgi:hypothetical protein
LSVLVSSVDPIDLKTILGDLRLNLEEGVGEQKNCSGEQLVKALKSVNSKIEGKVNGIHKTADWKMAQEKAILSIKGEDYSTIEELWAVCLQEGDSKLAEGASEDKTVDLLEMSDEGSCRSKTRSLLSFMFETWQSSRDGLAASIEKSNSKSGVVQQEDEMKKQIKLLYWGKEVCSE